jgi:hypothetical protein
MAMRSGKIGCGSWLFILVVVAGILAVASKRDGPPSPAPSSPPPGVAPGRRPLRLGDVGELRLDGASGVWIALDEASWDAMIGAEVEGARGGPGAGAAIYRLARDGKARKFPVGTRVRVVHLGFASAQVEVLGGEEAGARGWVQSEFVRVPPSAPLGERPY